MSRYYKILISKIESQTDNIQNQQEACSLLNSYSGSWEQTISFFHHNSWLVCILKSLTKPELEENVYRIAETIEHIATQNQDCTVVTAIGKTVEHLSSLPSSYDDAKNILEHSSFENQSRIISSDDIQLNGDSNGDSLLHIKENDPMVDRL